MRNEDYGRLWRLLADGRDGGARTEHRQPDISRKAPRSTTSSPRFPAATRPQEVVMLGGHLDSWHAATGATDNAIGSRDDAGGDAHPAGDRREAAPHDSRGALERRGTGSARLAGLREGALRHVREPEAGARELRRLLQHRLGHGPRARHDGVRPARGGGRSCARRRSRSPTTASLARSPRRSRRRGGSDHTSFNEAGLPGIGVQQDPIEYRRTPGTPTSTPTSASSKTMRGRARW